MKLTDDFESVLAWSLQSMATELLNCVIDFLKDCFRNASNICPGVYLKCGDQTIILIARGTVQGLAGIAGIVLIAVSKKLSVMSYS